MINVEKCYKNSNKHWKNVTKYETLRGILEEIER